jgi:hypothetical protein
MKSDIEKAFEEMKSRAVERIERDVDRFGDSYRPPDSIYGRGGSPTRSRCEGNRARSNRRHPESYEGKPPPNYVCNRCGKKGM